MYISGSNVLALTVVILVIKQSHLQATKKTNLCMCTEWGEWTEYGQCTAHCGGGTKSRNRVRQCNNDINVSSSIFCVKNVTQYQVCNTQECGCQEVCTPWSDWLDGDCSLNCGGGTLTATRKRQCQGSIGCPEKEQTSKDCNQQPCTGCSCNMWSQWSEYGPCSQPCGNGEQRRNRTRECFPRYPCLDAVVEYMMSYCNLGVCCKDACTPWSHWKDVSCSATCDFGTTSKTRNRICALASCADSEQGMGTCKHHTCPETCNTTCTSWGSWTIFPCSKTCGGGTRIRKRLRICMFADCLHADIHIVPCNTFKCLSCNDPLVCSSWSEWKSNECSSTCDVGTHNTTRTRTCNTPECKQVDTHIEVCKSKTCEETCDSSCTTWSKWLDGKCSHSCDEGIRKRYKSRICPYKDCTQTDVISRRCNLQICPVTCSNKYCSTWSGWQSSNCSVRCGGGALVWTRTRQCDNIDCSQSETTVSSCNTQKCDAKCMFTCSKWSNWEYGECSVSCDVGMRLKKRKRLCSSDDCETVDLQSESCYSTVCPAACDNLCTTWSAWEQIEGCSVTCGNGTSAMKRQRSCPNSECKTVEKVINNCTMSTCPETCDTCTDWSEWIDDLCSVSCGSGTKHRVRTRLCPQDDCSKTNVITVPCREMSCDIQQDNQEENSATDYTNICKLSTVMYHAHPSNCTIFIQCTHGQGVIMHCPDTTGWNVKINACDHKWKIPGCS